MTPEQSFWLPLLLTALATVQLFIGSAVLEVGRFLKTGNLKDALYRLLWVGWVVLAAAVSLYVSAVLMMVRYLGWL